MTKSNARYLCQQCLGILVIFLFLFTAEIPARAQENQSAAPVNAISKILIVNSGSEANVVFFSSQIPKYKIFTLKDPYRLAIDFENSVLRADPNLSNSDLFELFRYATRNGKDLRVVFKLKNDIKINKDTVLNPLKDDNKYRFIVTVTPIIAAPNAALTENSFTPLSSEIADKIINDDKNYKVAEKKTVVEKPAVEKVVVEKAAVTNKATNLSNAAPSAAPTQIVSQNFSKETKKIIVIDAGHGGKDPGAIGKYAKTKEKMVTLAFAQELKKQLDQNENFKVYLTRDSDYFISLNGRVEKSRKLKADLFISIHADSAESKDANGLSIYTLSEKSSDKQAERLAKKENKSDIIGGVNFANTSGDILNTLIALSQRDTMNNSAKFAEFAIRGLQNNGINVKHNTHRFAGFRVLTAPDVPSVLIELGYLTNKADEKKLNDASYRRKFSKVMNKVIEGYFAKN